MNLGMFGQAAHPPGRTPYECQEWDLQVIRWLDEFCYDEAWFGAAGANPADWQLLGGEVMREIAPMDLPVPE